MLIATQDLTQLKLFTATTDLIKALNVGHFKGILANALNN